MLLELIITLDSSTATGEVAFNKTKAFILYILDHYAFGYGSMRMVIVYYSGSITVYEVTSQSMVTPNRRLIEELNYRDAPPKIMLVMETIETLATTFISKVSKRLLKATGIPSIFVIYLLFPHDGNQFLYNLVHSDL